MMDETGTLSEDLPIAYKIGEEGASLDKNLEILTEFRSGELCPVCHTGHMDYNGLLNLECDQCRFTVGGCFT